MTWMHEHMLTHLILSSVRTHLGAEGVALECCSRGFKFGNLFTSGGERVRNEGKENDLLSGI